MSDISTLKRKTATVDDVGSRTWLMQGSEHLIQFFMIVQLPVELNMSASQFVPQQVVLMPATIAGNDGCLRCKKTILTGWKFCPECGFRVSCNSCGKRIGNSDRYCSNCGTELTLR